MELVDLSSSAVHRRAACVRVRWSELAAQQRRRGEPVRALAPGEDVRVQLDDRTERRGWVLRNAQERTDGAYVIVFGDALARRVPAGSARRTVPLPR